MFYFKDVNFSYFVYTYKYVYGIKNSELKVYNTK